MGINPLDLLVVEPHQRQYQLAAAPRASRQNMVIQAGEQLPSRSHLLDPQDQVFGQRILWR